MAGWVSPYLRQVAVARYILPSHQLLNFQKEYQPKPNRHSQTYIVNIEDEGMEDGGLELKQLIWNVARDTISKWMGQQLVECSMHEI